MGINDTNLNVLEILFKRYTIKTVLELGSQNFYQHYKNVKYGEYADRYYNVKGVTKYTCIDINGQNNALILDLSKENSVIDKYDLVTDFGTSEHVSIIFDSEPLYWCWKTKFDNCKFILAGSNPAKGNWPGHGTYYYTLEFINVLCKLTGMKIILNEEKFAMGNYTDGKEISYALDVTNANWISLEEFKKAFAFISSK
jgi:hypothetical protein